MTNHKEHLASVWSRLPGFAVQETLIKQRFSQMDWPWKSVKTDSSSSKNWHIYSIFRVEYRGKNHSVLPITGTKIQHLEQGLWLIYISEHQWNFRNYKWNHVWKLIKQIRHKLKFETYEVSDPYNMMQKEFLHSGRLVKCYSLSNRATRNYDQTANLQQG